MTGYGRVSETERVLVSNEGLVNLNWLKVQSTLVRKYEEYDAAFPVALSVGNLEDRNRWLLV
jgi:hypothetical protein